MTKRQVTIPILAKMTGSMRVVDPIIVLTVEKIV
jgi:hypothetical protein